MPVSPWCVCLCVCSAACVEGGVAVLIRDDITHAFIRRASFPTPTPPQPRQCTPTNATPNQGCLLGSWAAGIDISRSAWL